MSDDPDTIRTSLRLPRSLYDRLGEAAGGKTMHAEILYRLEASFDSGDMSDALSAQLLDEVREWRSYALDAKKDRHELERQLERTYKELLQTKQKLSDVTQALADAKKLEPAPPPLTPEAFDRLFAEVRATREAVQSIELADLAAQVKRRMSELQDKPKEREEFMREMQLISRMVFE